TATSALSCTSTAPFEAIVDNVSIDPTLTFNASPNTSCDPLNPNGTLEVSAATNGVDAGNGSTFAWFVGDGTTVPYTGTVAVVGNTSTITDLSAGVYTVTVTDSNTGCTHTDKFTVDDDQVYPEVTAVAV